MKKYNLDFFQAFKIVMDGGAVKGEHFQSGIFLRLNSQGQLVVVDASLMYKEDIHVFLEGMVDQKFRELTVMTLLELSH